MRQPASDNIDNTRKLDGHPVTRRLDDAAAKGGHLGLNELLAVTLPAVEERVYARIGDADMKEPAPTSLVSSVT
jgi:hypothetical protein